MISKVIAPLFRTFTLCAGLSAPAFAAGNLSAQSALEAYEAYLQSPPQTAPPDWYNSCAGHFFVDFDQEGIPEMVMIYRMDGFSEDACAVVCYCMPTYCDANGNSTSTLRWEVDRCTDGYTNHCNLLDLCACSIPMRPAAEKLPFGVMVFAPRDGRAASRLFRKK